MISLSITLEFVRIYQGLNSVSIQNLTSDYPFLKKWGKRGSGGRIVRIFKNGFQKNSRKRAKPSYFLPPFLFWFMRTDRVTNSINTIYNGETTWITKYLGLFVFCREQHILYTKFSFLHLKPMSLFCFLSKCSTSVASSFSSIIFNNIFN